MRQACLQFPSARSTTSSYVTVCWCQGQSSPRRLELVFLHTHTHTRTHARTHAQLSFHSCLLVFLRHPNLQTENLFPAPPLSQALDLSICSHSAGSSGTALCPPRAGSPRLGPLFGPIALLLSDPPQLSQPRPSSLLPSYCTCFLLLTAIWLFLQRP